MTISASFCSKISIFVLLVGLLLVIPGEVLASDQPPGQEGNFVIIGQLLDSQDQPVEDALVTASKPEGDLVLAETHSLEDGTWRLLLLEVPPGTLRITIEHPRFNPEILNLTVGEMDDLNKIGLYRIGEITLNRDINAGFWAATLIFLGVLLLIAFERLHSTTAALAGMSAVFIVSYVGGTINPEFFIFSFERGLSYINWEVIFLVMGMMIIVAIIEGTGIFQWMAFQAYRLSRGRSWLLVLILILITAVASALLDNFTTMLLMVPISLQIGLALGINPLALIIPEVLASNVGGISTLVGTPTNILIGAYANISFTDFLVNQTGGVTIALAALCAYIVPFSATYGRVRAQGGVVATSTHSCSVSIRNIKSSSSYYILSSCSSVAVSPAHGGILARCSVASSSTGLTSSSGRKSCSLACT